MYQINRYTEVESALTAAAAMAFPTDKNPSNLQGQREMDNCDVRFTVCGGGDLFRGLPLKNLRSLFLPFVVTTSRRARFDDRVVIWAPGALRIHIRAAKKGLGMGNGSPGVVVWWRENAAKTVAIARHSSLQPQ